MSGKGIYDIHCHIVPGVDDGATDIEETGKLLRMEYEQGVRTIIATPHFRFRMFETSAEKVKENTHGLGYGLNCGCFFILHNNVHYEHIINSARCVLLDNPDGSRRKWLPS